MREKRRRFLILVALAAAGCAPPEPPAALEGRWGRGAGACEAGLTITFERDAVYAHAGERPTVLFADPRYAVRTDKGEERIEIRYALPTRPGGVSGAGGRGVLELARTADGRLSLAARRFEDVVTGSVRQSLEGADDPVARTLDLVRCDPPKRAEGLL